MKKLITIFGPGDLRQEHPLYKEAELLGGLLAEAGFNVVTGGYGGVMEAVAKGARERGAGAVGVTAEVFFARGEEVNRFISREVRVKSAVDRMMELIDLADAFVALGNSPTTLTEVLTAWDYIVKGFIQPKPIVLLGDDWQAVGALFDHSEFFRHHRTLLQYAPDAMAAASMLTTHFGEQPRLPELDLLH